MFRDLDHAWRSVEAVGRGLGIVNITGTTDVTRVAQLEATGKSRSEAIRMALVEAASRMSEKDALAAEIAH